MVIQTFLPGISFGQGFIPSPAFHLENIVVSEGNKTATLYFLVAFLLPSKTTLMRINNCHLIFQQSLSLPFGGAIPKFSNRSLCVIGKTMASTSYKRTP